MLLGATPEKQSSEQNPHFGSESGLPANSDPEGVSEKQSSEQNPHFGSKSGPAAPNSTPEGVPEKQSSEQNPHFGSKSGSINPIQPLRVSQKSTVPTSPIQPLMVSQETECNVHFQTKSEPTSPPLFAAQKAETNEKDKAGTKEANQAVTKETDKAGTRETDKAVTSETDNCELCKLNQKQEERNRCSIFSSKVI